MAKGFKHGGGGSNPLNFKVVGNPQPRNPGGNTLWIDTDTPITGWIFSLTEPAQPQEGMVWILTGKSSVAQFNALKKNALQVYPISAKQYIGGAWVDVEAKSFQNGVWVDWVTIIPMTADIWKPVACLSDTTALNGTFSDGVYTVTTSGTKQSASIGTKNKMTISKETKTITAHVEISKAVGSYGRFYFYISNSNYIRPIPLIAEVAFDTEYNGDVKLDVSSVSGDYYLVIALATWNDVAQIKGVVCKYSDVRVYT